MTTLATAPATVDPAVPSNPETGQRIRTIAPAPGLYERVPFADYLAWDAVSQSELFRAPTMLHLRHRMMAPPEPPTAAMLFGSAFHLALLEPDRFQASTGDGPRHERTGVHFGPNTKTWAEAQEEAGSRILLSDSDRAEIASMVRAVKAHTIIGRAIGKGAAEVSAVWVDPETGILCKGRFDWLKRPTDKARGARIDFKSTEKTADADTVRRSAENNGWFFQAAFYRRGCAALFGPRRVDDFLCAIESAPPHIPANYLLGDTALRVGESLVKSRLMALAEAKRTNLWPGYPDESTLEASEWAARRVESEVLGEW